MKSLYLLLSSAIAVAALVSASSETAAPFLPVNATFPECSDVTHQPHSQRCQFIKDNNCTSDGITNYFEFYYCRYSFLHSWAIIPLALRLLGCFLLVCLTASEYLCPNLYTISKFLRLPDTLAGLTLLAFGNSAPDVFGTYRAIQFDAMNLAVAELTGASLFIMTVVVGTIAIVLPFEIPKELFLRDCAMYFVVFFLVVLSLMIGKLLTIICILLVLIYAVHVGVAIYSHSKKKARIAKLLRMQRSRGQYSDGVIPGNFNRNEDIDEIYLDGIASLPTIDDLDLEQIKQEVDDVRELPSRDLNAATVGTFGLKMLLRDLSEHSKMKGSILLISERPLTVDETNPVMPREPKQVPAHPWLDLLFPQFRGWNDSGLYDRAYLIITLPLQFMLRITAPSRDEDTVEEIINDIHTFTYDDNPVPTFDYAQDKNLTLIQTFLGTLFLWYTLFSNSLTVIIVSLIVASFAMVAVYNVYPPYASVHFIANIKLINYYTSFLGFIISICWISLAADEIINILHVISIVYHLSEDILGLTVFALGNSVGDFISNYTIASMGKPMMAFSACFGGPLLAICSTGLSGLILGGDYGLKFSPTLTIICVALFGTLLFLVYIIPKNHWRIDKRIGTILVSIWVVTCSLSILVEIK
ncbi:Sodium/potassium/calcium exchanger 6, mitochondrial [Candida viswanathii]|uniref:Sodium/potassium/calcium exchanger 6, mitochondrial n=1 Tax=Candida viswanathii TaxID=5486 RepID=A0A367YCB2_9ASCO|nr:Sodium/potassium/calcium exchanger 6, mitochondrial [Candida viswanathii]